MRTIIDIRQLYNNNIKLLNSYGFVKKVKQIFIAILLCLNIFLPMTNIHSYALDTHNTNIEIQVNKTQNRQIIQLTDEEKELLTKLISSEAKGESYRGQVAVASVVINRVLDPRFPNSVKEVIYQKGAFEPVMNKTIYQEPVSSAEKALEDALKGMDPTGNAVYFWNPDTAKSKWIKTLNPHMRIGNHVFSK